jgi:hypothetical protein
MKITYLTHACLLIKAGKTNIITDPWLTGPSWGGTLWHFPYHKFTPKNLPVPDIIFFSHGHDDHFHEQTINNFPKTWFKAKIIAPNYKEKWWREGLESKFKNIHYINHNKTISLKENIKFQVFINDGGSVDSSIKITHNKTSCFLQSDNLLSIKEAKRIRNLGKIDVAFMMPYLTGIFPAFYKWSKKEMVKLGRIKKNKSINYCANLISKLKPNLIIPYAVDLGTLGKNFYANFIHDNNKKDFLNYVKKKKISNKSMILNPGNFIEFSEGNLINKKITEYKFNKKEFLKFRKKYTSKLNSFEQNERKLEKIGNSEKLKILGNFIETLKISLNSKYNFNVLFQIKVNKSKNFKFLIDLKNKKILKEKAIPKLFIPKLIIFTEYFKIANLVKKKYPMNFMTFHNGAITCQRQSVDLSKEEEKFWNWIYNLAF